MGAEMDVEMKVKRKARKKESISPVVHSSCQTLTQLQRGQTITDADHTQGVPVIFIRNVDPTKTKIKQKKRIFNQTRRTLPSGSRAALC